MARCVEREFGDVLYKGRKSGKEKESEVGTKIEKRRLAKQKRTFMRFL